MVQGEFSMTFVLSQCSKNIRPGSPQVVSNGMVHSDTIAVLELQVAQ